MHVPGRHEHKILVIEQLRQAVTIRMDKAPVMDDRGCKDGLIRRGWYRWYRWYILWARLFRGTFAPDSRTAEGDPPSTIIRLPLQSHGVSGAGKAFLKATRTDRLFLIAFHFATPAVGASTVGAGARSTHCLVVLVSSRKWLAGMIVCFSFCTQVLHSALVFRFSNSNILQRSFDRGD
ncbi:uncharacterized protein BO72DRAFT_453966 [Aspergillus fijiensis CBS 313.89]|uniref:Uncharacterized protein n=1 Tax=Aspergillus fijiensis CBS 313.89 TaxID=1448319 RepID=A0A8G1VTI4_9EURO|nr:uncharacterized protein BO72DRAFT_453966 [Aspergillus fijiensis CBS 313.89]RAK71116.1 hypothetical protein BO72DRAFT_453966 [Aspergillus fijiensis CBS 313.89]